MSFGPSEKIDGANLTNKPNEKRWENGLGEMSCKPFSKDLIVRAIYVKGPQLKTQTATVAMQLWPVLFPTAALLQVRRARIRKPVDF